MISLSMPFNASDLCKTPSIRISHCIIPILVSEGFIRLVAKEESSLPPLPPGAYRYIGRRDYTQHELDTVANTLQHLLRSYEDELKERAGAIETPSIAEQQLAMDNGAPLRAPAAKEEIFPRPIQPELFDSPISEADQHRMFQMDIMQREEETKTSSTKELVVDDIMNIMDRIEKYGVVNKRAFIEDCIANV